LYLVLFPPSYSSVQKISDDGRVEETEVSTDDLKEEVLHELEEMQEEEEKEWEQESSTTIPTFELRNSKKAKR